MLSRELSCLAWEVTYEQSGLLVKRLLLENAAHHEASKRVIQCFPELSDLILVAIFVPPS
jgi:hypothetical protein